VGETPEQLWERAHGALRTPPVEDWPGWPAIWDDVLPPPPEQGWRANLDAVGAAMRT
jgi:hypothetical protein